MDKMIRTIISILVTGTLITFYLICCCLCVPSDPHVSGSVDDFSSVFVDPLRGPDCLAVVPRCFFLLVSLRPDLKIQQG